MGMKSFVGMCRLQSNARLAALYLGCCLAPSVFIGCWKGTVTEGSQAPQVLYRPVTNPIAEMCTDDTESRTDYFNVPVIRFEGSRIELNGTSTSANDLLTWALKRYTNLPEQAVWVQFLPDNKLAADQALLPIVKALPRLQIRRADFNFTCPKLVMPR